MVVSAWVILAVVDCSVSSVMTVDAVEDENPLPSVVVLNIGSCVIFCLKPFAVAGEVVLRKLGSSVSPFKSNGLNDIGVVLGFTSSDLFAKFK